MLSQLPIDLKSVSKENLDKEILRAGIIAELDAVNFYEQMAELSENKDIKKVLLDIAKEEKEHVGEFQKLLENLDQEYVESVEEGKKEVEEMLNN
jgi:rubrerythrin